MLGKTYAGNRFCWAKGPGIRYIEQNLFLAYVMFDKPIPGIGYVRQNLFLAIVTLDKTTYGT